MYSNQQKSTEYKKTGMQFIKFAVVGLVNTGVDWLVFFLLTLLPYFKQSIIYEDIAKGIAFIAAVLNSFLWNSIWTFREEYKEGIEGREKVKKGSIIFSKFLLVSMVGFVINTAVFYLIRSWTDDVISSVGLSKLVSLVFASGAAIIWNFFANKLWTYKSK